MIDSHVMNLLVSVITMRFEHLISNEKTQDLKNEVLQTI